MKQKDYLLDTNVISYIYEMEAGSQSRECLTLKTRLESRPQNTRIFLSPVTVGEIEYGILVGPFNDPTNEKYKKLVDIMTSYPCLGIDCDIARQYYSLLRARLYNAYAPNLKKGQKSRQKRIEEWKDPATSKELQIQENDLWISAIAWAYNLTLVTDDAMTPILNVAGKDIEFENWIR
ncbi:MAG: type II toxin-antitoxin system VapC family toxin [Desulfobacteraceae bacterium]|jgi:predicted nucleic acid-binding protein|nr:type II toxin-antitoxin system VapC family toxin [Desulfobacteraceae bacterium]